MTIRPAALILLLPFMMLLSYCAPAHAANCSSYSYTLTNGQVADATQVMANFNNILSCANNNLAKNGANSDITSLSGLTTPLSASQGGTGQATSIFSTANTWALNQTFATSTTSIPSINIPQGVAPSAPTNGDIWTTANGVFARIGGATYALTAPPVMQVQYQLSSGVNSAETFPGTSTTWTSRLLNTSVINNISGASLGSNQITLPAGTYEINIVACAMMGGTNAILRNRLYNVTDAAAVLYSLSVRGTSDVTNCPPFRGQFTLAGSKTLRIDTYTDGVSGNGGLSAGVSGANETYTDVYIEKLS